MIGFLQGQVLRRESDCLILLVSGVGYEVHSSPAILSQFSVGQEADLWIYTQVRDDAIQLFGFKSLDEKELFLALIKVNGVGPKSAMQILGAGGVEHIMDLINSGDAKGLSALPKVGKKTAEQIVLTLRGKLVAISDDRISEPQSVRSEVVSALVNLGFRLPDVERAVERLQRPLELESGIRDGLKFLTN
jgi:holliday junction DNA helicase RuvA